MTYNIKNKKNKNKRPFEDGDMFITANGVEYIIDGKSGKHFILKRFDKFGKAQKYIWKTSDELNNEKKFAKIEFEGLD